LSYQPARLHRLQAESIPRFLNVYKYGIWKKKTGFREYIKRGGEGAGGEDSKYSLRSIAALILIAGIPPHILHFTDFSLFLYR
jgi:hypothetical protein